MSSAEIFASNGFFETPKAVTPIDSEIANNYGESAMYAVEFRAQIKDGVIEIPREYRDRFTDNVKVILLTEEQGARQADLIAELMEHPLEIPNFKPLSREKSHERD